MRLRERDIAGIRTAAREVFGDTAVVRLFGSRLDDCARGGDIDLHVEAEAKDLGIDRQLAFRRLLNKEIGERAIDIVLYARGMQRRPIDEVAIGEGVVL
ncbi:MULTISPECIES: nucleotidyltransferase domain-containing protein [Sphingomonas]|uniref:nucleotidyltransferase domain-containing protein n=1 Tax=Sphingomonas TaxID=13687 RepID=UPI00082C7C48|nr:nucleotidyltransferase domain-containing protein [Sphingomonas sp. CCH10-B3]